MKSLSDKQEKERIMQLLMGLTTLILPSKNSIYFPMGLNDFYAICPMIPSHDESPSIHLKDSCTHPQANKVKPMFQVGTMKLPHDLTIKDVIYVPKFEVFLFLLVSSCMPEVVMWHFTVIIVVWDKMICKDSQSNHLYWLLDTQSAHRLYFQRWHQRLGHPFFLAL